MSGVVNVGPAPTLTDSPTITPSPTITETETPVPAGSTATVTPSITLTLTDSPTMPRSPTPSPTRTPGSPVIQFFAPGQDPLLAPNPAKIGDKVYLFMDVAPSDGTWIIYNTALERVASLRFDAAGQQFWDTTKATPGLYYIQVDAVLPDASLRKFKRKVVLWR